jgi:hypothetical protein
MIASPIQIVFRELYETLVGFEVLTAVSMKITVFWQA